MAKNTNGTKTNFPTAAIIVSFKYFFTFEKEKDAPSKIKESGVAIFDTSLIVASIKVGNFIPMVIILKPKNDPIIRGLVIIP